MIHLYVNTYRDCDPARNAELEEAMRRNQGLGLGGGFEIHALDGRPTFGEMIDAANERTGDSDVNIIANADIYFDDTIKLTELMGPKECYALTRWEWQYKYTEAGDRKAGGKVLDLFCNESGNPRSDAMDAWIWRGKTGVRGANFTSGVPGCDNRLTYLFMEAHHAVSNPAKSIKCYHLHDSDVRRYSKAPDDKIPMPYLLIEPHRLGDAPQLDVRS